MEEVGSGMGNETEEQIFARALEESLRYYEEIELPRLSQLAVEEKIGSGIIGNDDDSIPNHPPQLGEVDDLDYWEEWDDVEIESVVQVEESAANGDDFREAQTSHHNTSDKKKCATLNLLDQYVHKEVLPRKSNVSVGEVGNDGAEGFDKEAGRKWIYPCGFPVRKYQLDIVQSALFDNTLVSLPTGLGKTFIAAVVMYNFYQWFPLGKIIFLAPTRPLVAQQVHACYSIMGIPQEDTIELTGSKSGNERAKAWKEKRVFFATPQVLANDLGTGVCPGELVRCVVVDEAHRAAGKHAICQSIRSLQRLRDQHPKARFRIVALSATPGKNIDAVANVVTTLQISKLEIRDELSPDVVPYTHNRNVETVVVPLGSELTETRDKFLSVMDVYVERLIKRKLMYGGLKSKLNKLQILQARENFRKNPPLGMDFPQKGLVEGDFATCITLSHALGLLLTHGQRTFMSFIQGVLSGGKGTAVVKGRLSNSVPLLSLLSDLQEKLGPANAMPQPAPDVSLSEGMAARANDDNPFITSHPKMDHLRDIVVQHFEKSQEKNESTRVMIFCEYRDPVVEICNMLMHHWPLVKPMSFVGQASSSVQVDQNVAGSSKGTKGFTQKQQLQVLRGFRDGGYNVLVSTCVGEEGLDIGEVDLIVCYDAPHASPLRLVQRMGRTGRKREGRVVTLVTKDLEEHKHRQGLRQKSAIVKSLVKSKVLASSLCRSNARVLPPDTNPTCYMMPIVIPEVKDEGGKKVKKTKVTSEKTNSLGSVVRKGRKRGFSKNTGADLDDEKVNDRTERDLAGGWGGCNLPGEPSPKQNVLESRGKASKNVSKFSSKNKPKKGIKEFFRMQKDKILETSLKSDEAEGDDFAVAVKNKGVIKHHEDSEVIVLINEDVPAGFHSPQLSANEKQTTGKDGCHIMVEPYKEPGGSGATSLPPDLLVLEDAISKLFGNICCNLKTDSPYRCSVIKSHFLLSHSKLQISCARSSFSFKSITADVLSEFNIEEEIKKIVPWRQNSLQTVVPNVGFPIINFELLPEQCHPDGDNLLVSLWESSPVREKALLEDERFSKLNNPCNKGVNTVDGIDVIEILDSDEEEKISNNVGTKMKEKMPLGHVPIHFNEHPKEGLLWNVLGRKGMDKVNVHELNSTNDKIRDEKLKVLHLDSKMSLLAKKTSPADAGNLRNLDGKDDNSGKLVGQVTTPSSQSSCASKPWDYHVLTSPDMIEDKHNGADERTPEKMSVLPELPLEYGDCIVQKHPIYASSTPKVHRGSLFPINTRLPSPIGYVSKGPATANFDLLPLDADLLDDDVFLSSHALESMSQHQHSSSHIKGKETKIVHVKNVELPNFNLGSEYEFSSVSSDETVFENDVPLNFHARGEHFSNCANSNISVKENCEIQASQGKDQVKVNKVLPEEDHKYLRPETEKLNDLSEKFSLEEVPSSVKLKNKSIGQIRNSFNDLPNHSFTVTQIVDMFLPPEAASTSKEVGYCREKRKSDFTKQNVKGKSDENSRQLEMESFHQSVENTKAEGLNQGRKIMQIEEKKEEIKTDTEKEADFDSGDDVLLDLSADLFAGDASQDWISEGERKKETKKDKETNLLNSAQVSACRPPQMEDLSCDQRKNSVKKIENESCTSKARNDYTASRNSEEVNSIDDENKTKNTIQCSKKDCEAVMSVISNWSADGFLSKAVHSGKSKLSLALKGKKVRSNMLSIGTKLIPNTKKGSRVENAEHNNERNLHKQRSDQLKRGDNEIGELSTGRTILDALDSDEHIFQKKLEKTDVNSLKHKVPVTGKDNSSSLEFEHLDLFDDLFENQDNIHSDESYKIKENEAAHEMTRPNISGKDNKNSHINRTQNSAEVRKVESMRLSGSVQCARSLLFEDDEDLHVGRETFKHEEIKVEHMDELNSDLSESEGDDDKSHMSESEHSESSDDFENQRNKSSAKLKSTRIKSKEISIGSEKRQRIRLKHTRGKRSCEFLDTQAEETFVEMGAEGILVSDEEEDDCRRGQSQYYDPSFINDGGHNSQETEVDMHAKYLQSVRSPRCAKFKIPHLSLLAREGGDLAQEQSYACGGSDSYYMNDSFCVDGESNGEQSEAESADELEVLEAILAESSKEKKNKDSRRRKKSRTTSDEEIDVLEVKRAKKQVVKTSGIGKKQKRRRICVYESSEEEEDKPQNSSSVTKHVKNELDIPIVDDKLFEALSQDFEEPVDNDSGKNYNAVNNMDEKLMEENEQTREKCDRINCDSRNFTERRMLEAEEECIGTKKEVLSDVSGKNMLVCDNASISNERKEVNECKNQRIPKIGKDEKNFLATNDKCTVNWSSDLFDLSDDDELLSVITLAPNVDLKCSSSIKSHSAAVPSPMVSSPLPQKDKPKSSLVSSNGAAQSSSLTSSALKNDGDRNAGNSNLPGDVNQLTLHNFHVDNESSNSDTLHKRSLAGVKDVATSSRLDSPSLRSNALLKCSSISRNEKYIGDNETLIVVSPVEACRASEVMSALRATKGIRLVVYAAGGLPSIPYSLGRNFCLFRISAADLGRGQKTSDSMRTAFELFQKVSIVIEWEKESVGSQNSSWYKRKNNCTWNNSTLPANISHSANVALLNYRDAGILVLHSTGQVETARLIVEVARHHQDLELRMNLQPVILPKSFDSSDSVFRFYSSLPGVNSYQALCLHQQFPKISDFLKRCTSAQSIQTVSCLDFHKAMQLHKILASVHVAD